MDCQAMEVSHLVMSHSRRPGPAVATETKDMVVAGAPDGLGGPACPESCSTRGSKQAKADDQEGIQGQTDLMLAWGLSESKQTALSFWLSKLKEGVH